MFVNPNFTFNGIYSQDMNVSIATFDTNMFNDIGIEYTSDISIENDLVEYNPYYTESFSESSDIELNLVIYDSTTMEAIDIDLVDMEQIMDWLCTENFAPFISDDDRDLIYYFKVVGIQKVLTFNNKGYLKVTFKPYSKYAYRRREYEIEVNGNTSIEIFNHSRTIYCPIIEVTNLGDTSTINNANDVFKVLDNLVNTVDKLNELTNEMDVTDDMTDEERTEKIKEFLTTADKDGKYALDRVQANALDKLRLLKTEAALAKEAGFDKIYYFKKHIPHGISL